MGPPLNVRVQATVQGYLVTWEPPAYGKEQVRLYAVRWFRGPSEQLYGRAETTDTYYLGNKNKKSIVSMKKKKKKTRKYRDFSFAVYLR